MMELKFVLNLSINEQVRSVKLLAKAIRSLNLTAIGIPSEHEGTPENIVYVQNTVDFRQEGCPSWEY